MSDNPYTPPTSPLAKRDPRARRPTPVAIAYGLATDVVGTLVFGILVAFPLGGWLAPAATSAEDLERLLAALPAYQLFSVVTGLGFTALGGYVAARVANHRELYHGLLLGVAALITGELMIVSLASEVPLWQRLAHDLLGIPVAIFGAHLRKRRKLAPR